jgi:quercetin dioxygenase-like cupin family protein
LESNRTFEFLSVDKTSFAAEIADAARRSLRFPYTGNGECMMKRREFLASVAGLSSTVLLPEAVAQAGEQITHVATKSDGAPLQSGVVKAESLQGEGAAPGAKAYVHFNGPTAQLAALASGYVTLEPGAQPHPPHRHPEEEIMIIGEGSGEFQINGVASAVRGGDMVFAESNVLHGVRNTSSLPMKFYFVKMMAKAAC